MDPETQVTAPPGARPAPPEVGAFGAPDAQTAEAYRRAAGQRCWACNAPDSEPVRLQRRMGEALGRGHDAAAAHGLPDRPAHAAPRAPARARAPDGGPIEPGGGRADARETGHHGCGCPRRGCAAADAAQGCLTPARLTEGAP